MIDSLIGTFDSNFKQPWFISPAPEPSNRPAPGGTGDNWTCDIRHATFDRGQGTGDNDCNGGDIPFTGDELG